MGEEKYSWWLEGSHSSSVHRGIIPLSPPQQKKHSRYFSHSCSCKRSQRPAERGSVPANAQGSSRVADGASQHPEDTAGSTLAPIAAGSADYFFSFLPRKKINNITTKKNGVKNKIKYGLWRGRSLSCHIVRPCASLTSTSWRWDGSFSLNSSASRHVSGLVPSRPRQVHPCYASLALGCLRSGFISTLETKLPVRAALHAGKRRRGNII